MIAATALIPFLCLAAICACTSLPFAAASPDAIFVFGDSLSDTGNNNELTNVPFVFKSNWVPYGQDYATHLPTGRFSNGKIALDFMAANLSLPTPPAAFSSSFSDASKGANFASAGASVLDILQEHAYDLKYQVSKFTSIYKDSVIVDGGGSSSITPPSLSTYKSALYIVNIGSNDYLYTARQLLNLSPPPSRPRPSLTPSPTPSTTLLNIGIEATPHHGMDPDVRAVLAEAAVKLQGAGQEVAGSNAAGPIATNLKAGAVLLRLHKKILKKQSDAMDQMYRVGARKFLIFNIFPGGDVPYSLYSFNATKQVPVLNLLTFHHNRYLKSAMRQFKLTHSGVTLSLIDQWGLMDKASQKPADYGFTTGSSACCGAPAPTNGIVQCGRSVTIPGESAPTTYTKCNNPDSYVFWDAFHPTERMHSLIAAEAAKTFSKF